MNLVDVIQYKDTLGHLLVLYAIMFGISIML
jgi:hypothetical protein